MSGGIFHSLKNMVDLLKQLFDTAADDDYHEDGSYSSIPISSEESKLLIERTYIDSKVRWPLNWIPPKKYQLDRYYYPDMEVSE